MKSLSDELTVLIVEDERPIPDVFTEFLQDDYDVRTAYTGEQALELFDADVDIVLLDRRLPGISGDEVLGEIRTSGHDCRVAMVSAVDPTEEMLKLDIDEYVVKPVSRAELLDLLDEMSRRLVLENDLQQYLALTSRKQALEAEQTLDSLLANPQYREVLSELAKQRKTFTETLAQQAKHSARPEHHYSLREIFFAVVAMGLLAVVLVAIHALIPDASDRLLARGPSINPVVAYATAFVHLNDAHLYGNLAGLLFVSLLTYFLCLRLVAAEWFYLTFVLILVCVPVAIALSVYGLLDPFIGPVPLLVGFSGIVSAFVGFSFLSFLSLLRLVYSPRSVLLIGSLSALTATSFIFLLHDVGGVGVLVATALALVGALVIEMGVSYGSEYLDWRPVLEAVITACVLGGLYAVFGIGVVPQGESISQYTVVGHVLGLSFGFLIGLLTALALNVYPVREWVTENGYALPERLL